MSFSFAPTSLGEGNPPLLNIAMLKQLCCELTTVAMVTWFVKEKVLRLIWRCIELLSVNRMVRFFWVRFDQLYVCCVLYLITLNTLAFSLIKLIIVPKLTTDF